jgi:hypothetical protein
MTIIGIAFTALLKVFYRLMDAVDPGITNRIEHFAEQVPGVQEISRLRAHWVGHRLFVEVTAVVDETRSLVEGTSVAQNIQNALSETIPALGEVVVQLQPSFMVAGRGPAFAGSGSTSADGAVCLPSTGTASSILPPRYQNSVPSAAPMGAAGLKFDDDGNAAWNEIWTDFCDLALAGGPPHRGTLLEPGDPEKVLADPERYEKVRDELERGLIMVTGGLPVRRDVKPGWIGMECDSEEMAIWLLRAIVVENVSVRREGKVLLFPASPDFKLAREIKNVITVVAKTNHYWQEHLKAQEKEAITA